MGNQQVDFNKIAGSCSNLTSLATSLNNTTTTIQSSVKKIKSPTWEGKAATNFRNELSKLIDNLPVADRQLALASVFLANCSGNYKVLGEESVNKIKELLGGQEAIDKFDVNSVKDVLSYYNMNDLQDTTTTQPTKDTPTYTNPTYTSPTYTRSTPTYSTTPTYSSTISPTVISTAAPTIGTVTGLVTTALAGKTIEIPSSIQQGAYTVTGYDYWIDSGKEMTWQEGTNQRKVSDIWKEQGSVFKNGIAVINVDGVDRYLVAVSPKFGKPGDCIDVTLEDGTIIHCIIADSKGSDANSEWGHALGDGSINILEFEVQRAKYLQSGNPTTSKWNLPWDSSKNVASIKNTGSILGAQKAPKEPTSTAEVRNLITTVAETQLNNKNEKEYVAMFGESEGTAWCSEFASWCAKKSGYSDSVFPKFAGADEGAAWFKKHGLLQGRNYTPAAGDVLFTGGNEATHTALVVKVDQDGTIHTIEGNVGDKVVRRTHKVGDSNIYGFGTPDYSKLVKNNSSTAVSV